MSLTQTIGRPIRLCSIFDVDITVDVGFVGLLAVSFISVAIQSKDAALGLEYAALIALFFLVHVSYAGWTARSVLGNGAVEYRNLGMH